MTILTQTTEFVNYEHITKIGVSGEVIDDEEIGVVEVAVIKAHLDTGKKVVLGIYAGDEQLEEVLNSFEQWLNDGSDKKQLFRMPEVQLLTPDEENEHE